LLHWLLPNKLSQKRWAPNDVIEGQLWRSTANTRLSMAWTNPDTFEVLPHLVRWQPCSIAQWLHVVNWCDNNIGTQGQHWAHSGAEMQISSGWWFKTQEQAVWFGIRWL
jgi:hypothetical protein